MTHSLSDIRSLFPAIALCCFPVLLVVFGPSTSQTVKTFSLSDKFPSKMQSGLKIPSLVLGTMGISQPSAIRSAIAAGYRAFDCAPVYFNEMLVGDALAEELQSDSGVRREEFFVTSKLASPFHRSEHVETALRKTLTDLRLNYLDLYLIHWPVAFKYVNINPNIRGWENEDIDDSDDGKNIDPNVSVHETWKAMEELVDKGLFRYIGVSNFPVSILHELLSGCRIQPAVNQVEVHPYLQQQKLINYCQMRGVRVQAYSPLGTSGYKEKWEPSVVDDPALHKIAMEKGVTVAQLCLVWAMQRNTVVIAKSSSASR